MTVNAKELLKGKFWIVEEDGEKVGTLCASDDTFVYSCHTETRHFTNLRQLKKIVGADIKWSAVEDPVEEDFEINGYPCSSKPFNSIVDVKRKLPLFTKSEKSKSLYCAGYYIIRFDKGWVKSFCPKLITIERYEFKGPFKTEFTMKQELSLANKKSS